MIAILAMATGTGTPNRRPKPNVSPKACGKPVTGTPPVRNNAMLAPTDWTPSVIIKGETPKIATPVPLTGPMTSATAIAPRQPATIDQCDRIGHSCHEGCHDNRRDYRSESDRGANRKVEPTRQQNNHLPERHEHQID